MRKARAKKRIQTPDPRFNDVLISRFINCMMQDGKKGQARKIFYDAIDIVGGKLPEEEGVEVLCREDFSEYSLRAYQFVFRS